MSFIFIESYVKYFQGLAESIKGPTLLDLKDLFGTTLTTITYLFIVRSIGSIAGAFSGNHCVLDLSNL